MWSIMLGPGMLRGLNGRSLTTAVGHLHTTAGVSVADAAVAKIPEPQLSSSQVAQFKRGGGGRSSFSGNVITVFGGTGFMGASVINHLAKQGNQLILPHRCDPYWVRELKVVGDLGQILFFPFTLDNEDSIRKAVKYSNIVVNLIGTWIHTGNWPMHKTHVEGARRIAKIAREEGVERLIHLSCMGADPNYQPRCYKKTQFIKTKGLGELAVRDEFPQATIIRPSIIYGENDPFISRMMTFWRKPYTNRIFTYKAGKQTYKMPIYQYDASLGISRATMDPTTAGQTYEFVGPHCYRMDHLLRYMFEKARAMPELGFPIKIHGFRYDPMNILLSQLSVFRTWMHKYRFAINYEYMEFSEASNDALTGAPLIGDLGVNRLAEFENAGGALCYYSSFIRESEERYGWVQEPPLPIRSPPLKKQKAPMGVEEIVVEKKPFNVAIGT